MKSYLKLMWVALAGLLCGGIGMGVLEAVGVSNHHYALSIICILTLSVVLLQLYRAKPAR